MIDTIDIDEPLGDDRATEKRFMYKTQDSEKDS